MSKILAVADIHIHDYPQRNPTEKFRLYQSRTVCQNIIEAGQNEGCDIIVLAGDTIEKFLVRPYVQHEVKLFLDTLMSHFREGYIIWGNHDQDNKGVNSEMTDSVLSVMLPDNLHYADRTIINIDGCSIGFYNWRPEFDLTWIPDKVDVLFTHATICYTPEDKFLNQYLDESKFDLAICGDIHKPSQLGKYVSIGVPQQCKISDSPTQTAIVLDPQRHEWKRIDLNPHDNLLKFVYTEDRDKEGFDEDNLTWWVYKPQNQSIAGGLKSINVPAWEEIGNLIDNIIKAHHLEKVHGEVLQSIKDIDAKEVDFNFVITRFYCRNWRSIEECELYFGDHDRVLITGENGSGKSSLLSAIKYAFLENPHPKDLIQFGTKECWAEVDFLYQGNEYRIQRGSKRYGFWINGEPQRFGGKQEFIKEMHLRFPFIDYMDVYFFDSDHPKLIGDITPERKSEIISKFYKMDRIDAYNEQAQELLSNYFDNAGNWKEERDKTNELLKYIDGRLGSLDLPKESEVDLINKREAGRILQEKWFSYNDFVTRTANLQAQREACQDRLNSVIRPKLRQQRPDVVIDQDIQVIQDKINWITERYTKLMEIKNEGRRLYFDRQRLSEVKFCPTCKQPIKSDEHLEAHKAELSEKINSLLEVQNTLYNEFWNYGIQDKAEIDSGCRTTLTSYNQEVSKLMAEKSEGARLTREQTEEIRKIKEIEQALLCIGEEPEKVELPSGFLEDMRKADYDLSIWSQWNSLNRDKQQALKTIETCEAELEKMRETVEAYNTYIKLTGSTGLIYKEIMTKLANQFSDNMIKYEVVESTFRNKEHLNLESYYNLSGNNVRYVNCSDGQRTLLDIDFLSKVVTRMGLLIMDEFLKHLDAGNHDVVLDMIAQMDIGLTLISSHMESIPAFNNKSLKLNLNESGVTQINMK